MQLIEKKYGSEISNIIVKTMKLHKHQPILSTFTNNNYLYKFVSSSLMPVLLHKNNYDLPLYFTLEQLCDIFYSIICNNSRDFNCNYAVITCSDFVQSVINRNMFYYYEIPIICTQHIYKISPTFCRLLKKKK